MDEEQSKGLRDGAKDRLRSACVTLILTCHKTKGRDTMPLCRLKRWPFYGVSRRDISLICQSR